MKISHHSNRVCPSCGVAEGEIHRINCTYVWTDMSPERKTEDHILVNIPASVTPYAGDIQRFVDAMVYKLESNAHKGRWADLDAYRALDLLEKEVQELKEAMDEGNMVKQLLESADVANFALILAAIAMGQKG